ncbi:MAG: hypothetical protein AB4290_15780 [Spirulina sp.]
MVTDSSPIALNGKGCPFIAFRGGFNFLTGGEFVGGKTAFTDGEEIAAFFSEGVFEEEGIFVENLLLDLLQGEGFGVF